MTYYIYTISHPETNCVFYVGRTKNLSQRIAEHLRASAGDKLSAYMKELFADNKMPLFKIILECTNETVVVEEIKWIKHYRELGKLMNTSHVRDFNYGSIKISLHPNSNPGPKRLK